MGDREPDFGKADLTNCDREPIHVPGAIQPHGVLLALDAVSLKVVQIAGDTERLLGIRPCDMLGQASLEASIGPAQLDHLRAMLAKARPIPRSHVRLRDRSAAWHGHIRCHRPPDRRHSGRGT